MNIRIIPRLDIKSENLVKGINLEGLRILGKPEEFILEYNKFADEIFFYDTVASLYGRNNLVEIVKQTAKNTNIPLTVEGGIRSLNDIELLLNCGADKIAINTFAIKDLSFIETAVKYYGSTTIIGTITYKIWPNKNFIDNKNTTVGSKQSIYSNKIVDSFQVYTENAREQTGVDAYDWAIKLSNSGIGELHLLSIDADGKTNGPEVKLLELLSGKINIPIIYGGGINKLEDCLNVLNSNHSISALSLASALHYKNIDINDIKNYLKNFKFDTVIHNNI